MDSWFLLDQCRLIYNRPWKLWKCSPVPPSRLKQPGVALFLVPAGGRNADHLEETCAGREGAMMEGVIQQTNAGYNVEEDDVLQRNLGGGSKQFLFSPLFGEDSHFV